MHAKLAKAVQLVRHPGCLWRNIEVVYGYLHILGLENIASDLKTQQFDVSVLRFCISDVVNKHNNCGMRLRLLFSLWLSIISLFANRINKLSNTINKMSHLHMQKRTLHYAISVQKLSMTSMTQVTIQQTTRCLSRKCGWAACLKNAVKEQWWWDLVHEHWSRSV